MRLVAWLGSIAFVSCASLAACGGATDTGLFGDGSSGGSGGTSGVSGASGTSGSSGADTDPGTSSGTSGGASGTSGTSGSSGTSGTSGTSGGPPPTCTVGAPGACKDGEYCKVASCGTTGQCAPRPTTDDPTASPACGCDGVTYWNAQVAAFHGVNVTGGGACMGDGAARCSDEKPCAGDAKCNFDQGSKLQCALINPGYCWQLPKDCPQNQGGRTRRCANPNSGCAAFCDAIKQEEPFFKVQNCN